MNSAWHILLVSNSTLHGRGYLDHVEEEIRDILGSARQVLFFPYALHDREGYAAKATARFAAMGYEMKSVRTIRILTRRQSTWEKPRKSASSSFSRKMRRPFLECAKARGFASRINRSLSEDRVAPEFFDAAKNRSKP